MSKPYVTLTERAASMVLSNWIAPVYLAYDPFLRLGELMSDRQLQAFTMAGSKRHTRYSTPEDIAASIYVAPARRRRR